MSTYGGQSPIMGAGWLAYAAFADGGTVDRWIRAKGQALAPTYAPDHTYATPPACGQAILTPARQWNVDPVIVAAQMVKETAGGQSGIFRATNNTAGMGAENDDPSGKALHFASVADAFRAQVAHLADYADGKGAWTPSDPRAGAMDGLFGVAPMLAGLDHRWASPGDGYGQAVADLCNDLLRFAHSEGQQPMAETIFGFPVVEMHAAEGNYDTDFAGVELVIVHDEEASTAQSAVGRFQTAGQQASITYVIDPDGKRFIRVTAENETAYGCGNYYWNQRCLQFEMPGFAGKPYRADVLDMATKLIAYAAQKYSLPLVKLGQGQVVPGAKGITGHQFIPDPSNPNLYGGADHHGDPGSTFPWDTVLANARALLGTMAPTDAPLPTRDMQTWTDPATGVTVAGGMLARFKQLQQALSAIDPNEVILVIGHPVSPERVDPDGITRQDFEHVTLEWHKGASPERFDILEKTVNPYVKAAS